MEEMYISNIGVNKVIVLGNAGQNAEVKSTSAGKSVANFSLAINQPFRNKQDRNQRVEWVRCVAWDKLAQIAKKFVTRGAVVFVEGRLHTRKFEDRGDGMKTVTEIIVTSLRVLGSAKSSSDNGNQHGEASSATGIQNEAVPF